MALKGTLKDFGIAEILQLIAQQTKSGVLRVRGRDEEVHVWFDGGNVVRAEQVSGKESHLLGYRILRAGLISEKELQDALQEQRRTLKRLGDVLVSRGAISGADLKEMAHLQATETLYRLFTWKSGTYEFEPGEVSWDKGSITPIRGEAILMEGFRIVDEWPLVRKKIPSRLMTFEKLRELPGDGPGTGGGKPGADESSFGDLGGDDGEIGSSERRVMALVQPGRTVERLTELSRLGEFETCKALFNLVAGGYLKGIAPPSDEAERKGGFLHTALGGVAAFTVRVAVGIGMLALVAALVYAVRAGDAVSRGVRVSDPAALRIVGNGQLARIRAALEVYRLETGAYPADLGELLDAGLLDEADLHRPWRERYHYRRADDAFVLLPPFE